MKNKKPYWYWRYDLNMHGFTGVEIKDQPAYYAEYIKKLQDKQAEDILISELPLSTRAKDRLICLVKVRTLKDLLSKKIEDLYGFKNFGSITINEITDVLKDLGFSLYQHNENLKEKTLPRKIIQIATGSFTFPNEPLSEGLKKPVMQETHELYALCNDGTLWSSRYYQNFRQGKWIQLEPIPQDGEEN